MTPQVSPSRKKEGPFHVLFGKPDDNSPSSPRRLGLSDTEAYSDGSSELLSEGDPQTNSCSLLNDEAFTRLPVNVRAVILRRHLNSKHSDFYFKLDDLNEKI